MVAAAAAVSAAGRRRRLFHPAGAGLLPSAQRHDRVAGAGDLSAVQDLARARLRAGRAHHADLSVHRLDLPAARRLYTDRRPKPYSLAAGMGFTLVGLGLPVAMPASFGHDALRRLPGRHGLGDLPSRSIARRADGVGRAAWPRAVAVPGRRQYRLVAGSAARRLHRHSARPGQHRLVQPHRAARHGRADARRHLVQGPPRHLAPGVAPPRRRRRAQPVVAHGRDVAGGAAGADVLEILLHGGAHQLLHLLPDGPVRDCRSRRRRSISSCSSPRSRWARWSAGRSATASAASA